MWSLDGISGLVQDSWILSNKFASPDIVNLLRVEDGMDQAKWSIPRNRHLVQTKAEMPLQKPKFKIQGTWTLGCELMKG